MGRMIVMGTAVRKTTSIPSAKIRPERTCHRPPFAVAMATPAATSATPPAAM
ncbi:MAG TPA: hypothetical protein VJ829_01100 [Candidatus Binatia bacterium]|nr:hypothetical protein [Candidatus Binatia bacterium]